MVLESWVTYDPEKTDFPLENLPYGIFSSPNDATPRIGVAIGNLILDLKNSRNIFTGPRLSERHSVFQQTTLNAFMSLTSEYWQEAKKSLQEFLSLRNNANSEHAVFTKQADAIMHLPCVIGDYTDFFSSYHHVEKCWKMMDMDPPKDWKYMPKAYHGRCSSIVVSGTGIKRPAGQIPLITNSNVSVLQITNCLDFEVEVGVFIGGAVNNLGDCVTLEEAEEFIFGMVLLNDWSARDIQTWEMKPLGPFGSKNFATTISPWIVTIEALMPFKRPNTQQIPKPLSYLRHDPYDFFNFDLELSAYIKTTDPGVVMEDNMKIEWNESQFTKVTDTNYRYLYWTAKQHVVQHAINGCNMRVGDLMGTGTISGPEDINSGCLLELTQNGKNSLKLNNGELRSYLLDGDIVVIKGNTTAHGYHIGFGECMGYIKASELIIPQEAETEDDSSTSSTTQSSDTLPRVVFC